MASKNRALALAVSSVLLLNVLAGAASAGSHYPLSVTLWNTTAEGKIAGENFTAYAQVYWGDVPSNATSVTFRFGLGVISAVFPATIYPGLYAGSPGLYKATLNVTAFDTALGISGLAVFVSNGTDSANSFRLIATAPPTTPAGLGGPWVVEAGWQNAYQHGRTVDPGETVVFRIDTYDNGNHADASSLSLALYASPDVDFSETPTALTATRVATGIYEASYTVPANLAVSTQYVLQATINEGNWAQANATAEVWFWDSIVDYSIHNETAIAGELTVGDGRSTAASLAVNLQVAESGNPSHVIGNIVGSTDGSGKLAFSMTNDRTTSLQIRGWINQTAGKSQFVARYLTLPNDYVAPTAKSVGLDAVPLQNFTLMAWSGPQDLAFRLYDNGSVWADQATQVFVSTSRGPYAVWNLTTDANGNLTITVDFSAVAVTADDLYNFGINVTFRAPVGPDASASDGMYWSEDLELVLPDGTSSYAHQLFDTDLQLLTEYPAAPGSPFGVGAKYVGAKNTTGFEGGAVLFPTSVQSLFSGLTEKYDVWTGHDQPFLNILVRGPVPEFFGTLSVPSYWPDTNYTLLVAVVPSLSMVSSADAAILGAVNWTTVGNGYYPTDFVPEVDVTIPQVYGPSDMTVNTSEVANFDTHAYDDSLTFGTEGLYTWNVYRGGGIFDVIHGTPATFVATVPGDYDVRLVVQDAAGNFAEHWFVVHVLDITPPTVTAPADFAIVAGSVAFFNGRATDDDPAFVANASTYWAFVYNGTVVNQSGIFSYPDVTGTYTFWTLGVYNITLVAVDPAGHVSTDTFKLTVTSPDTVPPTVSAGSSRIVLAGQAETFTGTASDNDPNFPAGATCGWTFTYNGSSHDFNGTTFTFTFWTLGSYDVMFFCLDFWGNLGQNTITIIVDRPDKVAPTVSAGVDVETLTNTPVTLHADATDNDPSFPAGASAWWTFDEWGAARNLSGFDTSYTFGAAGLYTLTLTVRDGWGNVGTATKVVTVKVPDTSPPTIPSVPDATLAPGGTLSLRAAATDDDPNFAATGNISWSFTYRSQTVQQFGDQFTFVFDDVGNYTVTVRAADEAGNAALRTFTVRVFVPDTTPPTVTLSADHTAVVVGTRVNFTGSATDAGAAITDGSRFNWTFTYNGSLVTLHGLTPSFVFNAPGSYIVTLTVADAAGNAGTNQVAVIVTPPAAPPTTTPTSDLTLPLLVALLAAAAAVGFIVMRRKSRSPWTEFRSPPSSERRAPTAEPRAASLEADETEAADEDKDLDDLLK